MDPVRTIVHAAVGPGWGKSAMAQGYVARGWGLGWRSVVVQFVKGPDWHPNVSDFARKLDVEWHVLGTGMTWVSRAGRDPHDRADNAWRLAVSRMSSGTCDLVVLDEIGLALAYGWLDLDEVIDGLTGRASVTNVILTAPELPDALLDLADTITTFERTRDGLGRPMS